MKRVRALFSGEFVRNVSVLAGGTAFAGALAVLVLPLLTRIYSPAEFGVMGVFAALMSMISVVACLRYEIVIPLPETDESAANLLAVAITCLATTTLLVAISSIFFKDHIASLMNTPALAKYLWLLPIGVAATGAYSIFQYWATRKKAFKRISRTRIERSIGGVATQLSMGWFNAGSLGLICGQIISSGAGFLGLARYAYKEDHATFKLVNLNSMKQVARTFDKQPKFASIDALANIAGLQLPILLIASLTAGAEVGYLMLAMQIMQAPMSLIGSSIAQVFLSKAVEEHRQGRLADFTTNTITGLAKVGVGPLIFAGIIAPLLFGFVFGEKWQRAGELVTWMTPWFIFQFLTSPISMVLHVKFQQRLSMMLQVLGLIIRVAFVVGFYYLVDAQWVVEGFAIACGLFYFIYFFVVCKIAEIRMTSLFTVLKKSILIIFSFVCLAIIFKFTLSKLNLLTLV